MPRSALPSRINFLAAVSALGAVSIGVSASSAQAPAARSPVQPAYVDPVSAAVAEASRRFGVPEPWIWSVMRVESAGNRRAVSRAGAMGLMQVMPGTYAELRARYGLGSNPFDVRDNILAGTAYLREMHDRYGAQGMLAAYNAGPERWEAYIRKGRRLPSETVGYLARLAPEVGGAVTRTAPAVQLVRIAPTSRPTLFVQLGGTSAAASAPPERTSAEPLGGRRLADTQPMNAVFVARSALRPPSYIGDLSGPGQVGSAPTSSAQNPLFVLVRTERDHP